MMQRKPVVIAIVTIIIVLGLLFWYLIFGTQQFVKQQIVAPNAQTSATAQPATTATSSLGGQIYQQSQNPLQKKLPETNPIKNANPLQGAYKNPF